MTKKKEESKHVSYTSDATGKTIVVKPVAYYKMQQLRAAIEEAYRADGKPIDPPTYEVPIGGSDETQTFTHDESTIESDEDRAAWDTYLATLDEMEREARDRVVRFALRVGVEAEEESGWEEDQEHEGIKIPDDPRDRKLHYIMTEVLPTPREQGEVYGLIMYMSTQFVEGQDVRAAQDLFRSGTAIGE